MPILSSNDIIVKILDNNNNVLVDLSNYGKTEIIKETAPFVFYSDGKNLMDYTIWGSSSGVGDYDSVENKYIISIIIENYPKKNLIPIKNRKRDHRGVTFIPNGDGTVTLNGTAPSNNTAGWPVIDDVASVRSTGLGMTLAPGTYTLSPSNSENVWLQVSIQDSSGNKRWAANTFTVAATDVKEEFQLVVKANSSLINYIVIPQLEAGNIRTEAVPYTETFYSKKDILLDAPLTSGQKVSYFGKYTNLFTSFSVAPDTNLRYMALNVGDGKFTLSSDIPILPDSDNQYKYTANLFLLPGQVSTGADSNYNAVWNGHPQTVLSSNGYITIAYRVNHNMNPADYLILLTRGTDALEKDTIYSNVAIETTSGNQTFTVDTTVAPAQIAIKGKLKYIDEN